MPIINGTIFSDDENIFHLLFGVNLDDEMNANWSFGNDLMMGLAGDDIYRINSTLDNIPNISGQDTNTVITRIAATLKTNFENLTSDTAGFLTAINGSGNSVTNTVTGNSLANNLSGLGGNDILNARSSDGKIIGGFGKDHDRWRQSLNEISCLKKFSIGLSSILKKLSLYPRTRITGWSYIFFKKTLKE